MESPISLPFLI